MNIRNATRADLNEHAGLQPAVLARKLPDEILSLSFVAENLDGEIVGYVLAKMEEDPRTSHRSHYLPRCCQAKLSPIRHLRRSSWIRPLAPWWRASTLATCRCTSASAIGQRCSCTKRRSAFRNRAEIYADGEDAYAMKRMLREFWDKFGPKGVDFDVKPAKAKAVEP
uniref:N-acetyltransferase domain-containing protein n=1 Tax=Macrostomum lignano TaxID=282301 RepID=A0A1I8IXW4_9PLAT